MFAMQLSNSCVHSCVHSCVQLLHNTETNFEELSDLTEKEILIRKGKRRTNLREFWLNEKQMSAIKYVIRHSKITREEYIKLFDVEPETPVKEALERLKLIKDGKLTNASILLFGKSPQKFFLQAETRCARFKGTEPVKPYIDFQTLDGNVFDLIDRGEDFLLRNIRKSIWLVPEQVQREEKYEYPPDAIREAITNAVVHRDYESPSKVQVRVFDDYIEIWNPGRLPKDWTVEKLKQKHESIPKNPLLFKQLFWVKDVGGGTLDMVNECRGWGVPEPEFEDTGTSMVVIFRKYVITEKLMDKLGLNERQKKAIKYLKEHRKITNKEYCKLFGVVKDTTNRDLNDLLNKNLIEKKGSGPKVYYILTTVRYRPIPSEGSKPRKYKIPSTKVIQDDV